MSFKDWLIETLKTIIVQRDKRILELEKENRELRSKIKPEPKGVSTNLIFDTYSSSDGDCSDSSFDEFGFLTKTERKLYVRDYKIDKDDY